MTTLLPFQRDRRILHVPRLCCLKKETIGGNASRENRRSVTSGPSGPEARAARLFNFWTSPVSNEPCRARQWAQGRIFLSSTRAQSRAKKVFG